MNPDENYMIETGHLTRDEQDWLAESICNPDNADWVSACAVSDEEILIVTPDGRNVRYVMVLNKE